MTSRKRSARGADRFIDEEAAGLCSIDRKYSSSEDELFFRSEKGGRGSAAGGREAEAATGETAGAAAEPSGDAAQGDCGG
jgi:hypothetical protein